MIKQPIITQKLTKINIIKNIKSRGKKEGGRRGKERREDEERGVGGRRREMSPPKGKSWIRH